MRWGRTTDKRVNSGVGVRSWNARTTPHPPRPALPVNGDGGGRSRIASDRDRAIEMVSFFEYKLETLESLGPFKNIGVVARMRLLYTRSTSPLRSREGDREV